MFVTTMLLTFACRLFAGPFATEIALSRAVADQLVSTGANVLRDAVLRSVRHVHQAIMHGAQLGTPAVQALGRRVRPGAVAETNARLVADKRKVAIADVLHGGVERSA